MNIKCKKLFQVTIGLIDSEGEESINWRNENIVASTADEAMKKVKLRIVKADQEYFVSVNMLAFIDKL